MIEFAGEDDFRSIGLRPMEYRPAIIRRAMTRSALPLVQMHLQRPDAGVERRLSEVITLGYHLLDPRRRADSLQRMMLGRVHPQLSDEAVRIAQAKGSPLMLADDNDDVDTLLARGRGLLKASPVGGIVKGHPGHQISHAHFWTSAEGTPWDDALQSYDLSMDRSSGRFWSQLTQTGQRVARRPKSLFAVGSLVLAAMLWLAWPSGSVTEVQPSGIELKADVIKAVASEGGPSSIPASLPLQQSIRAPQSAGVPDSKAQDINSSPASSSPTMDSPVTPPVAEPMAASVPPTTDEEAKPNLPSAVTSKQSDFPADAELPEVAALEVSGVEQATGSSGPSLDAAMNAWDSLAADVSNTATTLKELLPSLAGESPVGSASSEPTSTLPPIEAEVEAEAEAMPKIDDISPAGASSSLDQWAQADDVKLVRDKMVNAVRLGSSEEADQIISTVASKHQVSLPVAATELLRHDDGPFVFESHSSARVKYLCTWTGRSVLAGDLSSAKQLLFSAHATAKLANSETLMDQVHDWQKTLDTMTRLSETAEHADKDSLTPVQKYAVGRYWALVRRDWAAGLPYLCSSSDPLVSKLAVQETLLGPDTTVTELIDTAQSYVALAEKNKGWMRDSYLLHADAVLLNVSDRLSSEDKLKLNRYQTDLAKRFETTFEENRSLQLKPLH